MITERMQQLAGISLNEADMSQADMSRFLKKMFKQKLGISIKARSIKAKSKSINVFTTDTIPNDIRITALKAMYGDIPSGVLDKDDINYGNIRSDSLSMNLDSWNNFVTIMKW